MIYPFLSNPLINKVNKQGIIFKMSTKWIVSVTQCDDIVYKKKTMFNTPFQLIIVQL